VPVGWVPSAMAGSESADGDDGPTINDELRATGQIPDDEDDMGDAAHLLFGRSAAPTNRDDAAASAAATSDAASLASSTTSKRRSPVWANFDEIIETVDGEVRVVAICKLCKSRLSGKSANGTGHLKRHMLSCKKKTEQANLVQTRLALNPDGSYRN